MTGTSTLHFHMFWNYFKTAFRNLWKNKAFSFINLSGLAIGMAGSVLILLWTEIEWSYDKFHEKKDRLYELWNRQTIDGKLQCWNFTPKILGPTLLKEYPEVRQMTRYNSGPSLRFLLEAGDRKIAAPGAMGDPSFLTMFSFPLLEGNRETALNNVSSIVLTEKLANKLFGTANPIHQLIRLENRDNFLVTGILKDLPNNTRFDFEYLVPFDYTKKLGWYDEWWGSNSTITFVELDPSASEVSVDTKIAKITRNHSQGAELEEVFLHPCSKWHLYSNFQNGQIKGGKIETVRLFLVIAGFILLIACINFMNLSTARSEQRAKEVGIRKVSGARRIMLVLQFMGESILLSVLAGIIALLLVQLCLPGFNVLVNKQLFIPFGSMSFWSLAILFVCLAGILAGSYPAFYLSSFQPVHILKGRFKKVNALVTPRKILVILQFSFAVILIIATLVVNEQIRYAEQRQSGYRKEYLIYHLFTGDISKNYELIRQAALNSGAATSVSQTFCPMTEGWSDTWGIEWKGKDPRAIVQFDRYCVDQDFAKTTGVQVTEGRDIDPRSYPTDSTAALLNESAVKAMGLSHPVGELVKDGEKTWHIVGVIRDFIIRSPYQPTRPMIVEGPGGWFNSMHIRLNEQHSVAEDLATMGGIFKKYNPAYPFEYHFEDDQYALKFGKEQETRTLASLFSGLAIFISCLGLFGLASYMAESRVKEIGVRKVLGASVGSIAALLSADFLKLVLISILIGLPIAWWAMNQWLAGFSYRISVSIWLMLEASILIILIALAAVSYQTLRAGMANPVRSLRTE
jgi:hypothetical protein